MEITKIPPISRSIINSLESSTSKLVSNEFHNHLPMGESSKGLGSSKIFLGVIFKSRSGKNWLRNRYLGYLLSFYFFRDRLWFRCSKQFLGFLEFSLLFRELLRKHFVFFLRFFQILTERSNILILFLDKSRERLAVLVFLGILEILRLSNHSYPNFS